MPKAREVRVARTDDFVKIKLRTPEFLYTYKTNPDEAEDLIKAVKDIQVVDFTPVTQKKKEKELKSDVPKKEGEEEEAAAEESKEKTAETAKKKRRKKTTTTRSGSKRKSSK